MAYSSLLLSFDQNEFVGSIFLDLSKVFDVVDHYWHLEKPNAIGLNCGLIYIFITVNMFFFKVFCQTNA